MGRIFCNDFHTNENIILFDVLNGSHESWANFEPQMSPVAHFFCFTLTSTNQISSETPCKAKNPWCIWKTHQEGLNEFSNFYIKFEMKSGYTAFSFQPWRYKKTWNDKNFIHIFAFLYHLFLRHFSFKF